MHADPVRPTVVGAIPQGLLVQLSQETGNGINSRVEYLGGVLLHYLLVRSDVTPEEIVALVARGRAYAGILNAA